MEILTNQIQEKRNEYESCKDNLMVNLVKLNNYSVLINDLKKRKKELKKQVKNYEEKKFLADNYQTLWQRHVIKKVLCYGIWPILFVILVSSITVSVFNVSLINSILISYLVSLLYVHLNVRKKFATEINSLKEAKNEVDLNLKLEEAKLNKEKVLSDLKAYKKASKKCRKNISCLKKQISDLYFVVCLLTNVNDFSNADEKNKEITIESNMGDILEEEYNTLIRRKADGSKRNN